MEKNQAVVIAKQLHEEIQVIKAKIKLFSNVQFSKAVFTGINKVDNNNVTVEITNKLFIYEPIQEILKMYEEHLKFLESNYTQFCLFYDINKEN
jgi:hypothetical protein